MTEAERKMKDAITLMTLAIVGIAEAADIDLDATKIALTTRNRASGAEDERLHSVSEILAFGAAAVALIE
jgi:hypothetical protein